ncbi:MAG: glycosyl transferase family 1 [Dehalococcoidia bacterium]|nr:glycosyl transferase family 1 [Dehalococcoidia bacterium]
MSSPPAPASGLGITPNNTEFVVLSFEGPDQPYSQAGGLGVRVTELSHALATAGFRTTLVYIGDPALPWIEHRVHDRLTLRRWGQWLSHYHPGGVYDGEEAKVADYSGSVPYFVLDEIARPAAEANRLLVVLAEDWQTADALCHLSDLLYYFGLRDRALLLWNANNDFSFSNINWGRLLYVATLTTVSRYMKHVMWETGLSPLVIPNGIPEDFLVPPASTQVEALRSAVQGSPFLFKIGRFDPGKRWLMAVDAVARLKQHGQRAKLVIRGGMEPHGGEVLHRAYTQGLAVRDVVAPDQEFDSLRGSIAAVAADADIINLCSFISDDFKRVCYRVADAVLANSGHEPFGIVGLEVMGAGGIAVLGGTGEDYAVPFENCFVAETDDPEEIVGYVTTVQAQPELLTKLRAEARKTAALFTWDHVIGNLVSRLNYLAKSQHAVFAGRGA